MPGVEWGSIICPGLSLSENVNPDSKSVTSIKMQRSAEIDVFHVLRGQNRVDIYECRGHAPGHLVHFADVQKWSDQRAPIVRAWLLEHPDYSSLRHTFNYWTTGAFSPNAIAFLTAANAGHAWPVCAETCGASRAPAPCP